MNCNTQHFFIQKRNFPFNVAVGRRWHSAPFAVTLSAFGCPSLFSRLK